jgi:hypothetical protein
MLFFDFVFMKCNGVLLAVEHRKIDKLQTLPVLVTNCYHRIFGADRIYFLVLLVSWCSINASHFTKYEY